MSKKPRKTRKKGPARRSRAGAIALGVLLVALAGGGMYYRHTLRLSAVEIRGTRFSTPEELAALAHVDSTARLFELDPRIIASRVRRHPWVARAEATRLPTGVLTIEVTERVPVALMVDASGRLTHYLDAAGYAMPAPEVAVFDVPLVHGAALPRHPTQPVESKSLREMLATLATLTDDETALVSDVRVSGDGITLYTPAGPQGTTIPVQLGRTDYRARIRRLRAFWEQAVLTRPERRFDHIDLRFSSQIVTRES